jgi:hypothetical protein
MTSPSEIDRWLLDYLEGMVRHGIKAPQTIINVYIDLPRRRQRGRPPTFISWLIRHEIVHTVRFLKKLHPDRTRNEIVEKTGQIHGVDPSYVDRYYTLAKGNSAT